MKTEKQGFGTRIKIYLIATFWFCLSLPNPIFLLKVEETLERIKK